MGKFWDSMSIPQLHQVLPQNMVFSSRKLFWCFVKTPGFFHLPLVFTYKQKWKSEKTFHFRPSLCHLSLPHILQWQLNSNFFIKIQNLSVPISLKRQWILSPPPKTPNLGWIKKVFPDFFGARLKKKFPPQKKLFWNQKTCFKTTFQKNLQDKLHPPTVLFWF